jgi:hypothetical protein
VNADDLKAELTKRGVVSRGVVWHPRMADVLVVYLWESDPRVGTDELVEIILTVPGVELVIESDQRSSVQLVRVARPASAEDEESEKPEREE